MTIQEQYNFERSWYARKHLQNGAKVNLLLLGGCEHTRPISDIWFNFQKQQIVVCHPNRVSQTFLPFKDNDYVFLFEEETKFQNYVWHFFFYLRYGVLLIKRLLDSSNTKK